MRRIGIVLCCLMLTGTVLLIGGRLPYFLFYVFSLFVIIPLIHSLITISGLNAEISIPHNTLYKNDTININYKIKNTSPFLIPYLIIECMTDHTMNRNPSKIITFLKGRTVCKHSEALTLRKRG